MTYNEILIVFTMLWFYHMSNAFLYIFGPCLRFSIFATPLMLFDTFFLCIFVFYLCIMKYWRLFLKRYVLQWNIDSFISSRNRWKSMKIQKIDEMQWKSTNPNEKNNGQRASPDLDVIHPKRGFPRFGRNPSKTGLPRFRRNPSKTGNSDFLVF